MFDHMFGGAEQTACLHLRQLVQTRTCCHLSSSLTLDPSPLTRHLWRATFRGAAESVFHRRAGSVIYQVGWLVGVCVCVCVCVREKQKDKERERKICLERPAPLNQSKHKQNTKETCQHIQTCTNMVTQTHGLLINFCLFLNSFTRGDELWHSLQLGGGIHGKTHTKKHQTPIHTHIHTCTHTHTHSHIFPEQRGDGVSAKKTGEVPKERERERGNVSEQAKEMYRVKGR